MGRGDNIGGLVGLGLTGAFTIGTIAAIVHARRRDESGRVERCQSYYAGEVPGYNTEPGADYLVLVQVDGVMEAVCELTSTWFSSSGEDARFVYDLCRGAGALPPLGALLATAHHRKAGSHYVGKQYPMRGLNLWGQMAGKKWIEEGKPFLVGQGAEFELRAGSTQVGGPYKKFFDTPEESVQDFLGSLRNNWPRAAEELRKKHPNPYAYAWYLQGTQSVFGGNYTSSLKDPGGTWIWGSTIATKMKAAAQALLDEAAYNGLVEYAEEVPELTHEEALHLDQEFPDRSSDYPLGSEYP